MLGSDVMAKERNADRVREAEAERMSRPLVEFRTDRRRGRVRTAVAAVRAAVTPERRQAVHPVAGR